MGMVAKKQSLIFSLTCVMFEGRKTEQKRKATVTTGLQHVRSDRMAKTFKGRATWKERAGKEFSVLPSRGL